jgi:hypothetical protein
MLRRAPQPKANAIKPRRAGRTNISKPTNEATGLPVNPKIRRGGSLSVASGLMPKKSGLPGFIATL